MPTLDLTPYRQALAAALPPGTPWDITVGARLKYSRLSVTDGVLTVRIPAAGTGDPARTAAWAATHAGRMLANTAPPRTKELVNGEGFPLFGVNHRLRLVDDRSHLPDATPAGPLTRHPGVPIIAEDGPSTWSGHRTWQLTLHRDHATASTVIEWYRAELLAWLNEQIPPLAARLGVRDGLTWAVRHQRDGVRIGSWASYYPAKHRVTASWTVAQFPRDLATHVLRHEMCHAARPGGTTHGRQWQARMATLNPQWREHETVVRKHTEVWTGHIAPAGTAPATDGPHVSGWDTAALA